MTRYPMIDITYRYSGMSDTMDRIVAAFNQARMEVAFEFDLPSAEDWLDDRDNTVFLFRQFHDDDTWDLSGFVMTYNEEAQMYELSHWSTL